MRTISALITATALVATLASCSALPGSAGSCELGATSGKASNAVTASGAFGSDPKAQFPTPLIASDLEITVLEEGTGPFVEVGDAVDVQATLYEGSSGNTVSSTGYETTSPLRTIAGEDSNIFGQSVTCVRVGSRLALAADAPAVAETNPQDTPVVLIIDVVDKFIGKANGVDQLPERGIPSVVLAPNGQPGIVIPQVDAPSELRVSVLKRGDGDVVADGDKVVVNYTGMLWDSSVVFDSSWDKGAPVTFAATSGQGGLIPGFAQALIGQKVGSQVIAVIPPGQAYGDTGTQGVPAGATLVFVFDVLGIQK
ncbi:MAG: FKBP-type peptidyl-prolyl cis-trans isomerase [Microbacteriaceae bacterium]